MAPTPPVVKPTRMVEDTTNNELHRLLQHENAARASPALLIKHGEYTLENRMLMVDWLLDMNHDAEHSYATYFSAVTLLDLFFTYSVQEWHRHQLQLVATACYWIADKLRQPHYESALTASQLLKRFTDDLYTKHQLIEMEVIVLNTVKFVVNPCSAYDIATLYVKQHNCNVWVADLAYYLLAACSYTHIGWRYKPSVLAATAISMAHRIQSPGEPLLQIPAVDTYDVASCAMEMRRTHQAVFVIDAPFHELRALADVYRKQQKAHIVETQPVDERFCLLLAGIPAPSPKAPTALPPEAYNTPIHRTQSHQSAGRSKKRKSEFFTFDLTQERHSHTA